MNKTILSLLFTTTSLATYAQKVRLNAVAEHFTNTKCVICASRNPDFYTNLSMHRDIMHLSIYPSSPYASCTLSQQNKTAQDARTNYYGIYGSTPRLVINGKVISSGTDYGDTAIFDPFQNLYSSFSVKVYIKPLNSTTLENTMVIKKTDTSNQSTAILFSGNTEDTIFLNGGNGESEHYNVNRFAIQETITLPATVGDSIVIKKSVSINLAWKLNRISAFALIQDTKTKSLIQSGKSALLTGATLSASNNKKLEPLYVFPNPGNTFINTRESGVFQYQIVNALGQSTQTGIFSSSEPIGIANLPNGVYRLIGTNTTTNQAYSTALYIIK